MTTRAARWHVVRARLKQRFNSLTADDLPDLERRPEEETLARLQRRTGLSREEMERLLAPADE